MGGCLVIRNERLTIETATPAHEVFRTGLKNALTMKNQALSIMQPQVHRLEHYRDFSAMPKPPHPRNRRLDRPAGPNTARSTKAHAGLRTPCCPLPAAPTHTLGPHEVLKNSLANFAFENFEIVAYTSRTNAARLRGAGWIQDNLSAVTELCTWR